MALRGDQRSHLVHRQRDRLLAYVRTHIRYKIGCTYSGHLLSQHLPTWDEWSSPGELIHPGDLASIASRERELDFAIAVMAIRDEAPGNRGDSLS